jgi:molybdopterin-guanine dinucleotide biosynthesis protein A
VTGVVLAGGRSTRFGRDKLAEPFRGAPLLHHAVSRVADVCGDVVVVIGPTAAEPSIPAEARVRFARDASEGEGPLAGVSAGLRSVTTTFAIVAGGDMPELQRAVLARMLDEATATAANAVALADGDDVRPLPCVVRVAHAVAVADLLLRSGRRSVRDLLHELDVIAIPESTWHELDHARTTLFDVDEPGDITR